MNMLHDELLQTHPTLRRCRFIEHIADLSAPVGSSAIQMHVLKIIISHRLSNFKVKQD